jgi:hypothetical protein
MTIKIPESDDLFIVVQGSNADMERIQHKEALNVRSLNGNGHNYVQDNIDNLTIINRKALALCEITPLFDHWFNQMKSCGYNTVVVPNYIEEMPCGCKRAKMDSTWRLVKFGESFFHTLCKKIVR